MKKVITKLWSVSLILVLLISTLLISVAPASGAPLAWSTQTIPGTTNYQLAPGTDATLVTVAPNGDIFAVDSPAVDTLAKYVYKSTDGGITWSRSAPVMVGAAAVFSIADLAVSPSYATDATVALLVHTAGTAALPTAPQVYVSSNGGISFSQLGAVTVGAATEQGTSIAISPTYNAGTGEIIIGTVDTVGGAFGNVYIWGRTGVLNWVAHGLAEDITDVAFSPNFAIDATILAIGSTGANTFLHNRVTGLGWDAVLGMGGADILATPTPLAIFDVGAGGAAEVLSSSIAIPDDFNGSLPLQRTVYVAVRSQRGDDRIYRVSCGSPVGAAALRPTTIWVDNEFTSLDFSGVGATGSLIAGTAAAVSALVNSTPQVFVSANPSSPFATFTGATTAPTGTLIVPVVAGQQTYVAAANDYATSSRIYAGTVGVNSPLGI